MRMRIGAIALAIAVVSVGRASARVINYNVKLNIISIMSASGACSGGTGLAHFCPVGPCVCQEISGTASGSDGAGPVTFELTIDEGVFKSKSLNGDSYGCDTAYGDIELMGSKGTESFLFMGEQCSSSLGPSMLTGTCFAEAGPIAVFAPCSGLQPGLSASVPFSIKGKADSLQPG